MTSQSLLEELVELANLPLEQAKSAPAELYRSTEIAKDEWERIFRKDWMCPGLAAEIPNKGDYITFTIAGEPVFCIRDNEGQIG